MANPEMKDPSDGDDNQKKVDVPEPEAEEYLDKKAREAYRDMYDEIDKANLSPEAKATLIEKLNHSTLKAFTSGYRRGGISMLCSIIALIVGLTVSYKLIQWGNEEKDHKPPYMGLPRVETTPSSTPYPKSPSYTGPFD